MCLTLSIFIELYTNHHLLQPEFPDIYDDMTTLYLQILQLIKLGLSDTKLKRHE